jgi:hypothetical protein
MPKTSEHQDHITSINSALSGLAVMILRTLATFLCGILCPFLIFQLDSWVADANLALVFLFSIGPYFLAGIVGCAIAPRGPYRAASTVVIGVFVGTILHSIIYPSNVFPLAIIAGTIMAILCSFLTAALWRLGSDFFVSEKNTA